MANDAPAQFLGQPPTLVVRLPELARLRATPAQFWDLCCVNPDLRLERTATGRVEVLPPAATLTGMRNALLTGQLGVWVRASGLGRGFGSDLGYTLPNSAVRSPDASWITEAQYRSMTPEQRRGFPPFAPTFAAELVSPGDRLAPLRRKMREYREQGTRLGWLINPGRRRVEVYRADGSVETLVQPSSLAGEGVLPGFVLDLDGILTEDAPRPTPTAPEA